MVGFDRAVLTVRHPVGGALRVVPLDVDVVHGAFDTTPYLGLAEGDRVKLSASPARRARSASASSRGRRIRGRRTPSTS